jgi:hypothetical protein
MILDSIPLPQLLGYVGGLMMPVFNIPLVYRVIKRKSSDDMSLAWVLGVETCVLLMVPSSIQSFDPVLKVFGITNAIAFSVVTVVVCAYHKRP